MGKILLSSDTESLMRSQLMGLDDISIDGEEWLVPVADAAEARQRACGEPSIDEAWVVSSDGVPGINLAAALRADNAALPVYLVMFEPSGSDASRAKQAGLTGMLSAAGFRDRFYAARQRRAAMRKVAGLELSAQEASATPAQAANATPASMGAAPATADATPTPMGAIPAPTQAPDADPTQAPDTAPTQVANTASTQAPDAAPAHPASTPAPPATVVPPLRVVPPFAPRREASAFVLAAMSGSGGVGKSATVAVAAYQCAERGFKTLVIDWDLQFGDMRNVMGDVPALGVDDALEDPSRVAELGASAPEGAPALVFAPKRLERSEELGPHLPAMLDAACASFDVVLVNTGSSWAESHAQLLERSNCTVFLLDQRASSVRSCQHALDLCLRLGIATGSFAYALNRCERGSLFSAVDIANVMHGAQVFELRDGGREVEELLGAGLAAELAFAKNDFCASVEAMLEEVLP